MSVTPKTTFAMIRKIGNSAQADSATVAALRSWRRAATRDATIAVSVVEPDLGERQGEAYQ